MATPAAIPSSRFFGLTAASRNPKPSALAGVKLSIAAIHFGVSCTPPRARQFRAPTDSSNPPRTIFVHDLAEDGSPPACNDPDTAVKIAVTATMPRIQPTSM